MTEISNKFKAKRGLIVEGDADVSGALTVAGVITAPTPTAGDNSTKVSTTAFVKTAIDALVSAAPGALDTLNELASALGNDPNFATTMTASLATKAPLASPALTGTPTAPTAAVNTNTTQLATTAFVINQGASGVSPMNGTAAVGTSWSYARQDHVHASDTSRAPLASPALTGTPTAPTAAAATNTTQLSTTAFVTTAVANEATARTSADALKANIDSPALTGTPTAPTAAAGTNTTQLATTAFVKAADDLKANAANPSFTGNVLVAGGLGAADFVQFPFVGGGHYVTVTTTVTGAFKITLPVLYTSSMISFDLSVYEYSNDTSFSMKISGYNYNSTPTWQNTSVTMIGGTTSKTPNVRFGNDGTNCCIWVGELADTWSYPQLTITNLTVGYSGRSIAWASNWSIAPVLAFDTVKVGPFAPYKAAKTVSPAFSGTPTVPTATPGTNSVQIASTAYTDAAVLVETNARTAADGLKANLTSPNLIGTPTAPTAAANNNTTQIATTAYTDAAVLVETNARVNAVSLKANIASPALTGIPTAPTAAANNNTTQLATTAYVDTADALNVKNNSTSANDLLGLVVRNQTLTLTAAWQDTGIDSSQLATGSYMVQLYVHDQAVGGGQWYQYYTGFMSWYGSNTNSADANEIILHRAGHAANSGVCYLRTLSTVSTGAAVMKLQIAGVTANSGTSTYAFKFRRLI